MIYLLPLSLASSYLFLGWQRQRQPKPCLIEILTSPTNPNQAKRNPMARLDDVTSQQNLVLSTSLLGMTTIGHLGIPLLRLLSLPGLFYLDIYFIRAAYREWQAERQIGIAISDAVLATGLLVTRQWGADALFATLFFASDKLQTKAKESLTNDDDLPTQHESDEDSNDFFDDATSSNPLANQPSPQDILDKPQWQRVIDQGALPLLTLSAVSMPLLGAKRALAVLLTNFGYDYRVMAPISTLSYLATARDRGIWLRDGQVLETLQQLDILVLDATWNQAELATLQPDPTLKIIDHASAPDAPDTAALIAKLQAEGHIVAYLGTEPAASVAGRQAHLLMCSNGEAVPGVHVVLGADQPARLQQLLDLRTELAVNRKRGLLLALAPSLINLSGIYFFHFGVVSTLLVDYSGAAVGMLNSLWPRLRAEDKDETGREAGGLRL